MEEDKNKLQQQPNAASLFTTSAVPTEDSNELRKKREEYTTDIRQKDRESYFKTKREANMHPQHQQTSLSMIPSNLPPDIQQRLKEQLDMLSKKTFTFDDFNTIIQSIHSEDIIQKHWGVTGLRKILSVESGPPIQPVIDANLVPILIDLIQKELSPQLTLEAAWALTNVASGTTQQTQTIIDKGGIQLFVRLLNSPYPDIAEQAVWAIGNVAGDCAQYRDLILRSGGVEPLIRIIQNAKNKNTVKHGTWALSNLCRGKPLPEYKYVKNAAPILCKVIIEDTDQEVLTDSCWALSYLSDGDNARLQVVIESGVVPTLVKLMEHPYLSILIPALRILGNLVTGDDRQTNYILEHGVIQKLVLLLGHEKKPVRREACWMISNITAGNESQISLVVRELRIIEKLFMLMKNDSPDIKREVIQGGEQINIIFQASWAISNSTNHGSAEDIRFLVDNGLLEVFVEMMDCSDVRTLTVILEATNNVLKRGDILGQENIYLNRVEALQGIQKLELLQKHSNQDVYQKAYNILERYYEQEYDI